MPERVCCEFVGMVVFFFIVGSFKAGKHGTILKKASSNEIECLCKLMKDVLRPYIPEYKGQVHEKDECILSVIFNYL